MSPDHIGPGSEGAKRGRLGPCDAIGHGTGTLKLLQSDLVKFADHRGQAWLRLTISSTLEAEAGGF